MRIITLEAIVRKIFWFLHNELLNISTRKMCSFAVKILMDRKNISQNRTITFSVFFRKLLKALQESETH